MTPQKMRMVEVILKQILMQLQRQITTKMATKTQKLNLEGLSMAVCFYILLWSCSIRITLMFEYCLSQFTFLYCFENMYFSTI